MASVILPKGALWMQNVDYPALWDRAFADAMFRTEGVIDGFEVAPDSALTISVSPGRAIIQGDEVSNQGKYLVDLDSTQQLTLGSVGAARTEYVYLAINDAAVAGGRVGDNVTLETSETPPGDSTLLLATLTLPGGAATVTAGMIADDRVFTGVVGPGSITDFELADGSVTTPKLADAAVTTAKLADGSVTTAKLAAGGVSGFSPGDIKTSIRSGEVGWLKLDGSSVADAQTLHPDLWLVVPASWKSGSTLLLPDMTNRVLLGGATPGGTGGSMSRTLIAGNIPSHSHDVSLTTDLDSHEHSQYVRGNFGTRVATTSSGGVLVPTNPIQWLPEKTSTYHHDHTITGVTQNTGSNTPFDTTPAHLTINYFIKT